MMYVLVYVAVLSQLVFLREWGQKSSLDRFLVADRRVGGIIGAMSVAASWIWAPAVFVSTRVGYEWGASALVWFIVPNMAALVIFAPVAQVVRKRLPDGYSFIESLHNRGGKFRETVFGIQLVMQVVIFAIQLVAGAELLSSVTGTPYIRLVMALGVAPFVYSFFSGLRTSVFTDALQYIVIVVTAGIIITLFPFQLVAPETRAFAPFHPKLLSEFGLSSALGLLVAIFADHQQWQRAFAAKEGALLKTYYLGAVFHGMVTLLLGSFGCLIARTGFKSSGAPELVGAHFIEQYYPPIFVTGYVIMALCALVSTLDSGLCAFSSLGVSERRGRGRSLAYGRSLMFLLVLVGTGVAASRPGLMTLWFVGGTIRLSAFAPTVVSIFSKRAAGGHLTAALLCGLVGGGAVFGYGTYAAEPVIRTMGMVLALALSALVIVVFESISPLSPPRAPSDRHEPFLHEKI